MKFVDQQVTLEYLNANTGVEILKKLEVLGRICYKSEEKITEDSYTSFINKLLKRKHLGVFEHHSVTFKIVCDRGISHEIVRHRIASYLQESTRYCDYNKTDIVYTNSTEYELTEELSKCLKLCEDTYKSSSLSPQLKRDLLPSILKTELYITMNLRELKYFIDLRIREVAHPRMRVIARDMLLVISKEIPIIFDDLRYELDSGLIKF
jgi:thymidylate synthase (FAD)